MAEQPDGVVRILVSYWYWGRAGRRKNRSLRELVKLTPLPVRLFADSGAFSAHTLRSGGATIDLADYAAWLDEHRDLLTVMANLDVIGDPKATARNQLALEGRGLPVLPVWHGTSPLAELAALCRDYRYVAVGGTASLHGRRKMLLAYTAQMALTAAEHGAVLHGFGRSSSEDLSAIPFYSADFSSWMQGARYGSIQLFDGRKIRALGIAEAARQPVLLREHGAVPQGVNHAGYAHGARTRPLAEYRREQHESLFVSAVAWKRFEAFLRRRHQVAPPPGQDGDGPVFYFADDVVRHLEQMMRAVEWLAGATGEETG